MYLYWQFSIAVSLPARVEYALFMKLPDFWFSYYCQVEALVGRIERIRHSPLNINISESVDEMMACIRRLQSSRKDEISGQNARNKNVMRMRSPEGKGTVIAY